MRSSWCAIYKFKESFRMQSIFLRATQLNRGSRFTPCATQSHLAGVAFAVAKAAQFLQTVGGAPTTSTSKGLRNAARLPAPVVGIMALGGLALSLHPLLCNSGKLVFDITRVSHTCSFAPVLSVKLFLFGNTVRLVWCAIINSKGACGCNPFFFVPLS